jgi:hypothetical protein
VQIQVVGGEDRFAMRSLRVVLDPDEATTHPMQAFVRDHEALRDYRLLCLNPVTEGEVALFLHVRGDRGASEAYGPEIRAIADGRGGSVRRTRVAFGDTAGARRGSAVTTGRST